MSSASRTVRVGVLATLTMLVALLFVGIAGAKPRAVQLSGDWASFNRCPVDDPSMAGADNVDPGVVCAASDSPSGFFKLGNLPPLPVGENNLQFGVLIHSDGTTTAVSGPRPLLSAPVAVPGGLLGLIGQGNLSQVLGHVVPGPVNALTTRVESAGPISDFTLFNSFTPNAPILTLPVKIHLKNTLLGKQCYIGSDSNPILLHVANTDLSKVEFNFENFDLDGTPDPAGPMQFLSLAHTTQGAGGFSVPGAQDCGPPLNVRGHSLGGLLDQVINQTIGLPSPAGKSGLVLTDTTTSLAAFANVGSVGAPSGQDFADAWHAAVLPPNVH